MRCLCTGLGLIPGPRKQKNKTKNKQKNQVKMTSKDTFLQMLIANEKDMQTLFEPWKSQSKS